MSSLVPVQFLARHALYNEGEVAGVAPDVASTLIARGLAVPFSESASTDSGDEKPAEEKSAEPGATKGKGKK